MLLFSYSYGIYKLGLTSPINNSLAIQFLNRLKYINREIETPSLVLSWKIVLRCLADERDGIGTEAQDGAASDATDKMDQP